MNKQEMMATLAKKTNLSKEKCEKVIDEFKKVILEVCGKGEEVNIRNFGRFKLQETKERKFTNPQTKRYYVSKPKKMIAFKSYKNFKYAFEN